MNKRSTELLELADGQITQLINLFASLDEASLLLPCPGREKLGDGTIAACAWHTADSYHRIADFLKSTAHAHDGDGETKQIPHHRTELGDLESLVDRLSAGRRELHLLTELSDEQLQTSPPASDMKFCDGKRTLEQIVMSLLHHQAHNVQVLAAALSR